MGQFLTGDAVRERFRELLNQIDIAHDEMRALSSDDVGTDFGVEMAERLEAQECSNRTICRAMDLLPSCVSETDRCDVEASLLRQAHKNDADIVRAVAQRIDEIFNPDGHFDEADRARRRGLHLSAQGPDGMSRLSGWIDPETRCYVEAITAAVRPGRHLPDGTLAEVRDERSGLQRCHDGIKLGRQVRIASDVMGSHRGHPVTVIVRTTLAELDQAAHAVTNPNIPLPAPARTGVTPHCRCVI